MNKSSANLQFEQYLDGASLVSARYRETGGEQPPMHLDVRILCAAIQRVCAQTGNSSERGFAPFSQHWAWPMSLAAVVVLSVSLVVIVQPQADSVGEPQIPLPRALDRSRPSPATPPVPRPLAEQQADGVQRGCENRSVLAPLWHAHKLAPSSEAPARCNAKETNSSGLSPSTHVHYEQWYDQRPRSRLTTYPIERASRQRYCSRSSAA